MHLPFAGSKSRGRSLSILFYAGMGVLAMLLLVSPFCSAANVGTNGNGRSPWVATWGAAMMATDRGKAPNFTGQTLREIVHGTVGGQQVRVWLSNRFGRQPLYIGAAHIAIRSKRNLGVNKDGTPNESGIQGGSDRTLTFHHRGSVTIPPGAAIVSDPVKLDVPPLTDLSISLYFPRYTMGKTEHFYAYQTSYGAIGNRTAAPDFASDSWTAGDSWTEDRWYFLTGVDVYAPRDSAVVALGDSITEGAYSTENANRRWPDDLAARLASNAGTKRAGVLGVVNAGIGGNRVLLNGFGPNALSRLNRDILARSGVRYVIVLESINDISRTERHHQPYGDLAERLEAGLAEIVMEAHQHGILVFGATLTPYQGFRNYSSAGEQVRETLNRWIRTSGTFDGVVDFDKAVRDPRRPLRLAPQYDHGDHIHPDDAGYRAMANAIDLSLFIAER